MNALVCVNLDQGIHKVKLKVARNEEKLCGFCSSINMANFEGFCHNKKLSANLFFLKNGDRGEGASCSVKTSNLRLEKRVTHP